MFALKAIVGIAVATAGALITALGPGGNSLADLSTQTWLVAIATILGSGVLIHVVDNIAGVAGGVAKAGLAFLTAGVGSLVVALNDGHITQSEYLIAFVAAVTATGLVYQAKE